MKKSTLISIIALLISLIGVLIALVAYFKRRRCMLCDDLSDEMFDDEYLDYDEEELDDEPLPPTEETPAEPESVTE